MYIASVVALMLVAPLVSIAGAVLAEHQALNSQLLLTWYVFWAAGVRLSLAGIRQIVQPSYTAQVILGIMGDDALMLVRELGIANCALGGIAAASLLIPAWRLPAAVAAAVFYGLAGINHALHANRSFNESLAMFSDAFASVVLVSVLALR